MRIVPGKWPDRREEPDSADANGIIENRHIIGRLLPFDLVFMFPVYVRLDARNPGTDADGDQARRLYRYFFI